MMPKRLRKCTLATNITKTSMTILGIKYVFNMGKCKEKCYIAKHTGTGAVAIFGLHSKIELARTAQLPPLSKILAP